MKKLIYIYSLVLTISSSFLLLFGNTAYAAPNVAATAVCSNARFITMPAWYRGLVEGKSTGTAGVVQCDVIIPNKDIGLFAQILAINLVEILLHVVVYASIAFIIVGGFKYITSSGSPDGNEKGRKTIANAIIGLVISIISIGIINFIFEGLL